MRIAAPDGVAIFLYDGFQPEHFTLQFAVSSYDQNEYCAPSASENGIDFGEFVEEGWFTINGYDFIIRFQVSLNRRRVGNNIGYEIGIELTAGGQYIDARRIEFKGVFKVFVLFKVNHFVLVIKDHIEARKDFGAYGAMAWIFRFDGISAGYDPGVRK